MIGWAPSNWLELNGIAADGLSSCVAEPLTENPPSPVRRRTLPSLDRTVPSS